MATITFEVPDEAMRTISETPEAFACAVRLAAAMFWYAKAEVSQGTAAAIAGLDRTDFLFALSRHERDIFVVDMDDLRRELSLG
jgi:hypothetical protein